MGSIVLGLIAGVVCLWGVGGLKKMLGADDAFDVFGVHDKDIADGILMGH